MVIDIYVSSELEVLPLLGTSTKDATYFYVTAFKKCLTFFKVAVGYPKGSN